MIYAQKDGLHSTKIQGIDYKNEKNTDDRTRTDTQLLEVDFESTASTIPPHRQIENLDFISQSPFFTSGCILDWLFPSYS